MQKTDALYALLRENDGILKTSDVLLTGISKPCFMTFVRKANLERAAQGVYMSREAWVDAMYLLQTRFSAAVFSHETALYLLDLAEREPLQHTVTVKTGYNYSALTKEGIKVHSIKRDLFETGMTTLQSPTGRALRAYNAERTLCDIIRCRKDIEMQDFQSAFKAYARKNDKNLPLLLRYAKAFHVEKILRPYMEVLL